MALLWKIVAKFPLHMCQSNHLSVYT